MNIFVSNHTNFPISPLCPWSLRATGLPCGEFPKWNTRLEGSGLAIWQATLVLDFLPDCTLLADDMLPFPFILIPLEQGNFNILNWITRVQRKLIRIVHAHTVAKSNRCHVFWVSVTWAVWNRSVAQKLATAWFLFAAKLSYASRMSPQTLRWWII